MADPAKELRFLECFKAALAGFPVGEIEKCETPDFLVRSHHGVIGIEVTEVEVRPLECGRSPHEQYKLREMVIDQARKMYAAIQGPVLRLAITFDQRVALQKATITKTANTLVHAIASTRQREKGVRVRVDRDVLPPEVISVDLTWGDVDHWRFVDMQWTGGLQQNSIQRVLDRKKNVATNARAKCGELWLLICNPLEGLTSQMASVEMFQATYIHTFDRAFWFNPAGMEIIELAKEPS